MKLTEIVLLSNDLDKSGIDLSGFNEEKKVLGHIENFNIYLQTAKIEKETKLISVVMDNKDICYIVGNFLKHGEALFQTKRTWVEPDFRGKSFMRKLLEFLKSN